MCILTFVCVCMLPLAECTHDLTPKGSPFQSPKKAEPQQTILHQQSIVAMFGSGACVYSNAKVLLIFMIDKYVLEFHQFRHLCGSHERKVPPPSLYFPHCFGCGVFTMLRQGSITTWRGEQSRRDQPRMSSQLWMKIESQSCWGQACRAGKGERKGER